MKPVNGVILQHFQVEAELEKRFFNNHNVNLLSPEGLLITMLMVHGTLSIKEAINLSNISYRSFYNILNRLKEKGIIDVVSNTADKRVRQIHLTDNGMDPILDIRPVEAPHELPLALAARP